MRRIFLSGARRNAAARTISLSRVQSSLLELPRRENEERKSTFLFRDYRLYGYSASAKCNRNLLLPSAYSYFDCAEDTPARQCANKFDIALAYSYL